LIFRQLAPSANYLARIKTDGTGLTRMMDQSIVGNPGVSPDGAWAAVLADATYAVSLKNGIRKRI
jgi:hypothetical protein